jgi:hypothetical protein
MFMSDQAVHGAVESATEVRLLDGRKVSMRCLDAGDADAVLALHQHLSGPDRYFGFFTLQSVGLHELVGKLTGSADGSVRHLVIQLPDEVS